MPFGNQGELRYGLIVDDQQATQKLNQFKTTLNSLGTPTGTATRNMGALQNAFKGVSGGLTSSNTLFSNTGPQVTTLGTKIKHLTSKYSTFAIGLSATTSGVLQLAAGFRDYNDAQIAVERVTRKVSLANEAVDKTTRKVVQLQKEGKTNTKEYSDAIRDQKQAQDQLSIQTQLLGEAQERLFDSQTQFATSVIPTILGAIGTLGAAFKDLGLKGSSLTGMFSKMETAVTGASGSWKSMAATGGILAVAIGGAVGLFESLNKVIKETQGAMNGTIKPTQAVKDNLEELSKLDFSSIEQSILTIAKQIGPGAPIAQIGKTELGKDQATQVKDVPTALSLLSIPSGFPRDIELTTKGLEDLGIKSGNLGNIWDHAAGSGVGAAAAIAKVGQAANTTTGSVDAFTAGVTKGYIEATNLNSALGVMGEKFVNAANFTKDFGKAWGITRNTIADALDVFHAMPDALTTWRDAGMDAFNTLRDIDGAIAESERNFNKWKDSINKANFDAFSSGIDKIRAAFDKFHKRDWKFEVRFEKAEKGFQKFLSHIGEAMEKGGKEGAAEYVLNWADTAATKLKGDAKKIFDPVINFINQNRDLAKKDPQLFMDLFAEVIGKEQHNISNTLLDTIPDPREWSSLGKKGGKGVTDGLIKGIDPKKVGKQIDKIQADIDALHGKTIQIRARAKIEGPASARRAIDAKFSQHGAHEWVYKPTLYIAGEAGKERVDITPANKMSGNSSNSNSGSDRQPIHVHIHINRDEFFSAKEIDRYFEMRLGRNFRRSSTIKL